MRQFRTFASSALRRQGAASSATASRLPRLTLYTGGKECSLCEVAKADLAAVNAQHPFIMDLFNIRDPPVGTDPAEAKKWRRLYQYDIPVLHMEGKRMQKHRIDKAALIHTLETWSPGESTESSGEQR